MIVSRSSHMTPQVQQVLTAHHQLWDGATTITYRDHEVSSVAPSHGNYRSAMLPNSKGVPHLWITQNMAKTTYGSYAIQRAEARGERLRITWIVYTADGAYRYAGQIQTHEYFDPAQPDRIHIETYDGDTVNIVYTTHQIYAKANPYS